MSTDIDRIEQEVDSDLRDPSKGDGLTQVKETLGVDYWDAMDVLSNNVDLPARWNYVLLGMVAGVHLAGKSSVNVSLDELVSAVNRAADENPEQSVEREFHTDVDELIFALDIDITEDTDEAIDIAFGLTVGHELATR